MIQIIEDVPPAAMSRLGFVWLEITGRCQLECVHCYAESGPAGNHGTMTVTDWERIIDECVDLGVSMVQFIGGEPTLHPDLPALVGYALARGLEVEVFTNLVHVSPAVWEAFDQPGVRLACSWYSSDPSEHQLIVRRNTHAHTKDNLAEAVRRGIPVRAGIIGIREGQDIDAAVRELADMGVSDVGVDHLRQVGRGIRDRDASIAELCGNCGDGVVAVGPDGSVWPCVFSRWMTAGNIHDATLVDIVTGPAMTQRRNELGFTDRHCDHEHDAGLGEETVACRPSTPCSPPVTPSATRGAARPATRTAPRRAAPLATLAGPGAAAGRSTSTSPYRCSGGPLAHDARVRP